MYKKDLKKHGEWVLPKVLFFTFEWVSEDAPFCPEEDEGDSQRHTMTLYDHYIRNKRLYQAVIILIKIAVYFVCNGVLY